VRATIEESVFVIVSNAVQSHCQVVHLFDFDLN
jgi:hypothetical protein